MATKPKEESILSLSYRGALPEILRKIADQLENGNAHGQSFTCRVGTETFELSATISLTGRAGK